ncbi:MAG: 3-dehydroquinate synthase, partial [Psychroserpens sp.]
HGLIKDRGYFETLTDLSKLTLNDLDNLIFDSVIIKKNIVMEDPNEQGVRKHLNFGHTLGHAVESYFLESENKSELLHGEAIAIGMILECYISSKSLRFSETDLNFITDAINNIYKPVRFNNEDYDPIIELLKYDKKNEHGNINFVLLEAIGQPKINCLVTNELIIEAFEYYNNSLT